MCAEWILFRKMFWTLYAKVRLMFIEAAIVCFQTITAPLVDLFAN